MSRCSHSGLTVVRSAGIGLADVAGSRGPRWSDPLRLSVVFPRIPLSHQENSPLALWNTPDEDSPSCLSAIARAGPSPADDRSSARPPKASRHAPFSTTYSITDIAALKSTTAGLTNTGDCWLAINNASPAQVVAGEGSTARPSSGTASRGCGPRHGEERGQQRQQRYQQERPGRRHVWTTTTTIKKTKSLFTETNTVENGFMWTAGCGMSNLGSNFTAYAINDSGYIRPESAVERQDLDLAGQPTGRLVTASPWASTTTGRSSDRP